MTTWFTSDPHFTHKFLSEKRGFTSPQAMDEELIRAWNSVVEPDDVVYVLGDIYNARKMHSLKGIKRLIWGNHDENTKCQVKFNEDCKRCFEWIKAAYTAAIPDPDAAGRHKNKEGVPVQYIYLHHYACRVWKYSHHGSWHCYGHSHGNLPDDPYAKSMDVGVDAVLKYTGGVMRPISYDELKTIMSRKQFRPVDHHGRE